MTGTSSLPGDLIGLQGALFEASAYAVEALTEVQLCLLPRRKIWSLFEKTPELAFDVTWLGAREESHVDENLVSAGRRSATERVAALMSLPALDVVDHAAGMAPRSRLVSRLTSQADLAAALRLALGQRLGVSSGAAITARRRFGMSPMV